jgi:hypothetical protein
MRIDEIETLIKENNYNNYFEFQDVLNKLEIEHNIIYKFKRRSSDKISFVYFIIKSTHDTYYYYGYDTKTNEITYNSDLKTEIVKPVRYVKPIREFGYYDSDAFKAIHREYNKKSLEKRRLQNDSKNI